MGGFNQHAEEERQTNQELPGGSRQGQVQSELLLTIPDTQLHQVIDREEQAYPLAEGTLTVVSVSLPGQENRIGLVAKVGEFEYPLANDTACLRSSPHQYVFSLSDGVLVGLTLPGDTPLEAVDLFELLLEQCCDFAVQQEGLGRTGEVSVTKPGNGERQEVVIDSARQPAMDSQQRASEVHPMANQPGLGLNNPTNQARNKYVVSGPDAPAPSQLLPAASGAAAFDTRLPGSLPSGGNKYVVSGLGMPAAPPGLGQGTTPSTSAYDRTGAYGGAGYGSQVPIVNPDGSVTGAQARPRKVGERLAAIVGSGAAMLGQGIVKGGEWTAAKIQEHGQKQKAKLVPNERPAHISPSIQAGARGANEASRTVDATAKKVVGGAVYVITAAASSVGAAVHVVGGTQPSKEPKVGARALAIASVDGIAHVFDALETSGKRVMATSREVGAGLMEHKYGAQAGQLTSDGMSTLGHMIHAGWTMRKLAFRTVARSAATNTALHVIRNGRHVSGNGSEVQAISGWNTAPATYELDEARRVNQASTAVGMI